MTPVSYIQPSTPEIAFRGGMLSGIHRQSVAGTAARLAQARLGAVVLAEYPGPLPRDLAQAYECQLAALAQWPGAVIGWKVARIAPEGQGGLSRERAPRPVLGGAPVP